MFMGISEFLIDHWNQSGIWIEIGINTNSTGIDLESESVKNWEFESQSYQNQFFQNLGIGIRIGIYTNSWNRNQTAWNRNRTGIAQLSSLLQDHTEILFLYLWTCEVWTRLWNRTGIKIRFQCVKIRFRFQTSENVDSDSDSKSSIPTDSDSDRFRLESVSIPIPESPSSSDYHVSMDRQLTLTLAI